MFSPVLIALATLYVVLGFVIFRRLRKPTCRVCLLRQSCPNRELEHFDAARTQCWRCGQATECETASPESTS